MFFKVKFIGKIIILLPMSGQFETVEPLPKGLNILLFISSIMTRNISDRIDEKLRSKNVLEKTRDKLLEIQASGKRIIFGPTIHPEVARIISKVDQHSYVLSRIYSENQEWKKRFAKHTRDLGKRFIGGDDNIHRGISNEELFPLIEEMRYVLREEFYLPVMPKKTIPKDTLQLNRGIAMLHINFIKDVDNPDPLDLELIAGVDPYFEIDVNKAEQTNLKDDLTIGINTYKLRQLLRDSPEVKRGMVNRHYPTVSEGKLVAIAYVLDGIPGREKEIPPIEYSSL